MNESILLIEDEQAVLGNLQVRLQRAGYIVDTAREGGKGLDKATNQPFDLIILDVMLPDRSGFDVCRDIRLAGLATPILFLTARHQTNDKVIGLKLGGDDYVTKPFKAAELVARIEVLLRRVPVRSQLGVHKFGPITIDMGTSEVTRGGQPVHLSVREFQLLSYFVERPGVILSRSELLRSVWGYDQDMLTRTVDIHISSLRQKLEENPKQPELFVTVAGIGYRFMGSRGI